MNIEDDNEVGSGQGSTDQTSPSISYHPHLSYSAGGYRYEEAPSTQQSVELQEYVQNPDPLEQDFAPHTPRSSIGSASPHGFSSPHSLSTPGTYYTSSPTGYAYNSPDTFQSIERTLQDEQQQVAQISHDQFQQGQPEDTISPTPQTHDQGLGGKGYRIAGNLEEKVNQVKLDSRMYGPTS